jgi:hypothetical protein
MRLVLPSTSFSINKDHTGQSMASSAGWSTKIRRFVRIIPVMRKLTLQTALGEEGFGISVHGNAAGFTWPGRDISTRFGVFEGAGVVEVLELGDITDSPKSRHQEARNPVYSRQKDVTSCSTVQSRSKLMKNPDDQSAVFFLHASRSPDFHARTWQLFEQYRATLHELQRRSLKPADSDAFPSLIRAQRERRA